MRTDFGARLLVLNSGSHIIGSVLSMLPPQTSVAPFTKAQNTYDSTTQQCGYEYWRGLVAESSENCA